MKKQTEVIISGIGGQGTILCGTLLGKAVTLYDHRKATLTSEYGVETRGTFAKSDLIISDDEIYFPDATEPDIVICLAQAAYVRYSGKLPGKTCLIYNSDQVTADPACAANETGVALDQLSLKAGNPATANIITMGIIAGKTGDITPESSYTSIREFFKKKGDKVVSLNERAFDMGYQIGLSLR